MNPRKEKEVRKFVENIVSGKARSRGQAYAMVKGRKKVTQVDHNGAYRWLKSDEVQELVQQARQRYLQDAPEAYRRQWALVEDPMTPPHVKNAILDKIQDRAGLGSVELSYTRHDHQHQYPELMMTADEVRAMLDEPKKKNGSSELDVMNSRQEEGSARDSLQENS